MAERRHEAVQTLASARRRCLGKDNICEFPSEPLCLAVKRTLDEELPFQTPCAISPRSSLLQAIFLHIISKQNEGLDLSVQLVLFPIVKSTLSRFWSRQQHV